MRLEDLDFDALINQMWGSEAALQSYLESEVPRLCSKICGPDAPVPVVRVTYPPLKGESHEGVPEKVSANVEYRVALDNAPATILNPAVFAGHKIKLPQIIARELIHHWEVLGAIGEDVFDYPEAANEILKDSCASLSEKDLKEIYSPQFIAKAVKVARDFEIPLEELLFPKISLTVHMPPPEEGIAGSA